MSQLPLPSVSHAAQAQRPSAPRRCAACDVEAGPAARFCAACGTALSGVGVLPAPSAAMAERRLVTVLFCDIVASSALAARLDPEDYATLLVTYRNRCASAVERHGGHVAQYLGDGVLACFGFPRALGRDAELAVDCSLDLVAELVELARDTTVPHAAELAVRVGIETGVVVAGRLTEDNSAAIDSLVGSALNTAARLQQLAPPFGVVIGAAAHELVAATFDCEELDPSQVARYGPAAQRAFLVRGRMAESGSLLPRSGKADLIGREAELEQLVAAWRAAQDGAGQVVLLSGEPGIGKSRLVHELLSRASPPATVVVTCTPQSSATALHAATQSFRDWLVQARERGSRDSILDCLIQAAGLPRETTIGVLDNALGQGKAPAELAPAERRRLLMALLRAWMLGRAEPGIPPLIIVEDLHWSDPSFVELLISVAAAMPSQRGMLLVTCRTGQLPPALMSAGTLTIQLAPLDPVQSGHLLDRLSAKPLGAELRPQILARADGVPLFIEELARADHHPVIPHTLQQALAARLDALGPAKPLAQIAAVLGGEAERDLLGVISGLGPSPLDAQIRRLVSADVLAPKSMTDATVVFRHVLLQQSAYESLLHADRRRLHARAADLLEALRPELTATRPELVAAHRAAALQHGPASALFERAIRLSLTKSALAEAEEQARRGLECAAALNWPEAGQAELELRILLGRVLIGRRGYAAVEVREAYERAAELAAALQDDRRSLALLRGLASYYQVRGPLSRAHTLCARMTAVAEAEGDPVTLADAHRRHAWNDLCMGDLAGAEAGLARTMALLEGVPTEQIVAAVGHDIRALALANASWLAMLRRTARDAAQVAQRAAEAAAQSPRPVCSCYALTFAASALQEIGEWDAARKLAERAHHLAEEKGLAYWVAMGEVVVGRDHIHRGDAAQGLELIRGGLQAYERTGGALLRPYILTLLSDVHIALGDLERAGSVLADAEQCTTRLEAHAFTPIVLIRHATLAARCGRMEEQHGALIRAAAIAQAQGAWVVARFARRLAAKAGGRRPDADVRNPFPTNAASRRPGWPPSVLSTAIGDRSHAKQ